MSRSGYDEYGDGDQWASICWRGAVRSAIRGKRGQAFLREMAAALDAMPQKQLAADVLADPRSGCCAMGAVARARGLDTTDVDPYERDEVANLFGIAPALAAEIAYENDQGAPRRAQETPEQRWTRMREWVAANLRESQG